MRVLALALLAAIWTTAAVAQPPPPCPPNSEPSLVSGGSVFGRQAAQWQAYFGAKVDVNNGIACNLTLIDPIFPDEPFVTGPGHSTPGWVPQWADSSGLALSTGLPVAQTGPAASNLVETASNGLIDPSLLPFLSTGTPTVATNAAMAALAYTFSPAVLRLDYASGNGAPPAVFASSSQTCGAQGYANDGGCCTNASGGGSWVAPPASRGMAVDIREFGAKCDNATDDASAFTAEAATGWSIGIPGGGLTCLDAGTQVHLANDGQGVVGLAPFGSNLATSTAGTLNLLRLTGQNQFVRHIQITMPGAADGCPVLLDGAQYAMIEDVVFKSTQGIACEINGARLAKINHVVGSLLNGALVSVLNAGSAMSFTASISGHTLTVTAVAGGSPPLQIGGYLVSGAGIANGNEIIADGHTTGMGFTGVGGTGTYKISGTATIGSAAMTASFRATFACAESQANVAPAWVFNDVILGFTFNDGVGLFEDGYCQSTRLHLFAVNTGLECVHLQNTFDGTPNPNFLSSVDLACQTPSGYAGFDFQSGHALHFSELTFCNGASYLCTYFGSGARDLELSTPRFNGSGLADIELAGTTAKILGGFTAHAGNNVFQGSISGTVLTVTAVGGQAIIVGNPAVTIAGTDSNGLEILPATYIVSNGTGTGGTGTYNINNAQTWPSASATTPARIHEGPSPGGCTQFTNPSQSCPAIAVDATANDVIIQGVTAVNNAGYGVEVATGASQITLDGNRFAQVMGQGPIGNLLGAWHNDGTQDCSGVVVVEDGQCSQEQPLVITGSTVLTAPQTVNTAISGGVVHLDVTGTASGAYNLTTPSAATILAAMPGGGSAGATWVLIVDNEATCTGSCTATLVGGTGVTATATVTVPDGQFRKFLCTVQSGGTTVVCAGQANLGA